MSQIGAFFLNGGQRIVNSLLPPRCFNCAQIIENQGGVCAACWGKLTFIETPFCQKCGHPFDYAVGEESWCAGCLAKTPLFDKGRSVLAYTEASKKMLLSFKHGDAVHMAPCFSQWLKRILPEEVDLLAPVPLHWTRLLKRGYNQSALLTNSLSRITGIETIPDLLRRSRKTISQGGLTRLQRHQNVTGAFYLRKKDISLVQQRHILVVDDVLTTGATLFECIKTLKESGAKAVSFATLARVCP